MEKVLRALRQALRSCWDPTIILLLFVPFLLALVLAAVLFFTFGTVWVDHMTDTISHTALMDYLTHKWAIVNAERAVDFSYFVLVLFVLLVLLPVSYLVAVLVVSFLLMPLLIKKVQKRKFPTLEMKYGGNLRENLWRTFKTSLIYVFLLVLSFPLWFIPGTMIAVPVLLGAYLGQNIFVYDILQKFASQEERQQIEKDNRLRLFLLGVILGLMNYVPLGFVVMPVFAGLAYVHFCLNELQELRRRQST